MKIQAKATKETVVWKIESMFFKHVTELAKASTQSDFLSIYQCANKLRKYILYLEQELLEEPLKLENIMEGKVKKPKSQESSIRFCIQAMSMSSVLQGNHTWQKEVQLALRFACSGGKLIPGKHLSLGLTIKSLTGSKTVVSLLNHFGQWVSDETIRQINLGWEKTLFKTRTLVPSHIIRKSNLSAGPPWANFDINFKTPSGANTTCHTCWICYQNMLLQEEIQSSKKPITNIQDASISNSGKRKICCIKKIHPAEDSECFEFYWKKPRLKQYIEY